MLNLENCPGLLVEVKRHKLASTRDAEGQLRRYCALQKPLLALLTDGVFWVIYYVGQRDITAISSSTDSSSLASIACTLATMEPKRLLSLRDSGTFSYLSIIEEGLQRLSDNEQRRLLPHFVATVTALLFPFSDRIGFSIPDEHTIPKPALPDEQNLTAKQPTEIGRESHKDYDPFQPPDLSHTFIVQARFGPHAAARWGELIKIGIAAAVSAGYSRPEIKRIIKANLKDGIFTDQGYSVVPETQISYQGQSSIDAWRDALQLAKALNQEIEVVFRWQDKDKALNPGMQGKMHWSP